MPGTGVAEYPPEAPIDLLEGGLSWFRHGPKKPQAEIDKERARSISNGSTLFPLSRREQALFSR